MLLAAGPLGRFAAQRLDATLGDSARLLVMPGAVVAVPGTPLSTGDRPQCARRGRVFR
jgi:hypothetical protein